MRETKIYHISISHRSKFALLQIQTNIRTYSALLPAKLTNTKMNKTSTLTEAYNSLPTLYEAGKSFKAQDAEKQIRGPIRDMFMKHGVYDVYGLALLHKHFGMKEDQRLVEYGPVSTAWSVDPCAPQIADKYGGHIVPRSYRFKDKAKVPYEFAFTSNKWEEPDHPEFFGDLENLLVNLQMQDLFGVRLLESHDNNLTVEVTEGRNNVMIPRGAVGDDGLQEALWTFNTDTDRAYHCRQYCYKVNGTHRGGHGCA